GVTAIGIGVVHRPRGGCVGGGAAGQQADDQDRAEQAGPAGGPQSLTGHETAQQRTGNRTRKPLPKESGRTYKKVIPGSGFPEMKKRTGSSPDYRRMVLPIILLARHMR